MTTKPALNHSPVSLPPGSFDLQKLAKGLEGATSASDEKRGDVVAKALKAADSGEGTAALDQGARPDQKRVEVSRDDLGTTETVLVHDTASEAARQAEDAPPAPPAAKAPARKRAPAKPAAKPAAPAAASTTSPHGGSSGSTEPPKNEGE